MSRGTYDGKPPVPPSREIDAWTPEDPRIGIGNPDRARISEVPA